jgi:hypothetical protein
MEHTLERVEELVAEWEDSGLLMGIERFDDKAILALNLERAASDMVVKHSNKHNDRVEPFLFPIMRRINDMYGYRPIVHVRELLKSMGEQWEEFILLPEAEVADQNEEIEDEFCVWFVAKNGSGFFERQES